MKRLRYKINHSAVTIIIGGDILSSKAEVIVSSDNIDISMEGGVANAILRAGGDIVREDARKKLPAKLGDVVVSTAGNLKYQKFIFHCLTDDHEKGTDVNEGRLSKTEETNDYILRHSVSKCLDLFRTLDLGSIAFPCIEFGATDITLKEVAEVMTHEIVTFLANSLDHYDIELYIQPTHIKDDSSDLKFIDFFDRLMSEMYPKFIKKEFYDDGFSIYLTIEGSSYEGVELPLEDPNETIRNQITGIVKRFKLPNIDNSGTPIMYMLGQLNDADELEILAFEDEDGREQSLLDYNIQPRDHLHLISFLIAGGCDPLEITCLPKRKSFIRRLFAKKSNDVFSSVFAPHQVRKGTGMMVQVYLYKDEERDAVCFDASRSDRKSAERAYLPLNFKLELGSVVDVNIRMRGIEVVTPHKAIVWQGSYTKANFYVEVPEDYNKDQIWVEVFLSVNGALLGELDFLTEVTTDYHYEKETAPVISRQYKKIFISYAHQDESKVQYIARAYEAQGVDYFFDRDYLKPGDIFPLKIKEYIDSADLFILCWSVNAAQSEYVELERQRALKRAYPNVMPFEDAPLSIYPMSIEPRAELPDDMRDTYNFKEITD